MKLGKILGIYGLYSDAVPAFGDSTLFPIRIVGSSPVISTGKIIIETYSLRYLSIYQKFIQVYMKKKFSYYLNNQLFKPPA